MAQITRTRRSLWIVVGLAMATMIVVGSVAVGFALTPAATEIVFVYDDTATEFRYGDVTQTISLDDTECDVTEDSLDGPIMSISGAVYTKTGDWVSDEVVGVHHIGLGVNTISTGGRTNCGLINSLNADTTDALTLDLGSAADEQMIESVDFDFDALPNSVVRIDYLDDGSVMFTEFYELPADASEVNEIPGAHGSQIVNAPQDPANIGTLFDGVRISMDTGRMELQGGGEWEDPATHRTVFHLVEATPEISIDSTTNGTDGAEILVGEPVAWSNLVTNTGSVSLHDVEVTDSELGTIACLATDLAPGESTTCSADGVAAAGEFMNEATATGMSPGGVVAMASDTSSYFGILGCGDSQTTGGPDFEDDPLGAFYNGPTKGDAECGAAVDLTTDTTDDGQIVNVAPPAGSEWDGVTGLITIEWDVEEPTDDGIARTMQQLIEGDPLSNIIVPWCEDAVGIVEGDAPDWWYELDPDTTYPTATGDGDTCLVKQTTTVVEFGGEVFTQTTEVFYLWDDPLLGRF